MHPKEIVRDHYTKLREQLMVLDGLSSASKRVVLFKCMDHGWSPSSLGQKDQELSEACNKTDLLIKLSKNLLSSLKVKGKQVAGT